MDTLVSLSELVASGIVLRPAEAVAIVGEICRQRAARLLPGLPSTAVIRLASHGEIVIEGPVPAGDDVIARAGQLLETLLAPFDAPPEYRASGALRLVVARALGSLDLPPFASLEEFCGALARFTTLEARDVVAGLVSAWTPGHADRDAAAAPVQEPITPALTVVPSPIAHRARKAEYAVWIAAPAAAAVIGYFLALQAYTVVDRRVAPVAQAAGHPQAMVETIASVPQLPEPPAKHEGVVRPLESSPHLVQAYAYSPSFGPAGALYFHEQHGGSSALKLAETNSGGAITRVINILDDRSRNFHPRPSPDGRHIAFDSDRDGVRGVFVANADGSDVHRVSGEGFASVPSWSPDGRRLAFVRAEPNAPRVWNLWLANADGSDLRRLTRHRVGQAWGGSWFPDGRRIAYSVENQLVILDLLTGQRRVLQSPRAGQLVRTPAVSPTGERIVFQVHHDGAWIADVRTGGMTRVLADPTAEEFTWASDGHHVAYHSHTNGAWSVWMMAL